MVMRAIRDSAWSDLIGRAWDGAPVRYADAVTEPLVTSAEIMAALSGAASPLGPMLDAAPRSGPSEGVDCRLYIDGGELRDPAAFLPFRAVGSTVEEYGAAVSRRLNGRRFGIVVNEFQKICPPLWRRLGGLLSELAGAVGFSAAKAEAVLFIGDYSATPFGVHKDSAAVLQFSIAGSKTMLFWGPGELPADYRSMASAELEKTALSLTCGPRDFLAWSPDYHHVAKNDEPGLVVTLSVPVYLEFEPIKIILQSLQAAFSASAGSSRRFRRLYRADVAHALETTGALPEEFEMAWRHVETLIGSRAALGWLRADLRRRYGAFGLEPPAEEARPMREVELLAEPSRPQAMLEVVWASAHGLRRATARDVGPEGMFVIDADAPPVGASLELGLAGESPSSTTVARVVYRDDAGFAVFYPAPARQFAMALHEWMREPA
jgi:hypothetical protein